MKLSVSQKPSQEIAGLIRAGYGLFYLLSHEERRVLGHLKQMADKELGQPRKLAVWSVTDGFRNELAGTGSGQAKGDPAAAMDTILAASSEKTVYVLLDFHPYLTDDRIIRRVRDVYHSLKTTGGVLIFLGPVLKIPEEVAKDVQLIDYPLPDAEEIEQTIKETLQLASQKTGAAVVIPEVDREAIVRTLGGLTTDEASRVINKIVLAQGRLDREVQSNLLVEKQQLIRKTEILDYIDNKIRLEDVGGLGNFKRWVRIRSKGFTRAARTFGLPQPKGILFTGISGCGKSLAIQGLAHSWSLPLLRLDMGRVFAGFTGTPEEAMRRALKTVEAVAPAILWIDEIEMGISVFSDSVESGATSRIFAMFLTWMQEKTAPVFVGATANDIDRLPPEFIRKGRFDEIFFVDLPEEKERRKIFKIHLNNRGKDVSDISLEGLARSTNGYSGAEIEQGIVSAMYEAFAEGRELSIDDMYRCLGRMVPLSVTMKEQIIKTKRWAENRAVRAS